MSRHLLDRPTKMIIGHDLFNLNNIDSDSLILSIKDEYDRALLIMNLLLQKYKLSQRNPQIYLNVDALTYICDITTFVSIYSKELHIRDGILMPPNYIRLKASDELPDCPILTDFTIERSHIDESVPAALSRALHSGKLPRLRCLTLVNCCGKILRSDWPDKVKVSVKDDGLFTVKFSCKLCSKKTKQNRRRKGKLK